MKHNQHGVHIVCSEKCYHTCQPDCALTIILTMSIACSAFHVSISSLPPAHLIHTVTATKNCMTLLTATFEDGANGRSGFTERTSGDHLDWTRTKAATLTTGTGPSCDHTSLIILQGETLTFKRCCYMCHAENLSSKSKEA